MSEEFEIKKISQETLGEYLLSVRQQLGLTTAEVAETTDILEKFVVAIEQGRYQILPPDAYVMGFLKKLAKTYQVSFTDLLEQYKKEKGIVEHTARQRISPPTGWRAYFSQISVTPKLISVTLGLFLGAAAFGYVLLQVFSVNRTPSLTIIEPSQNTVLSGSSVVFRGQTEPGVSMTVNGQNVLVESDGSFSTTLSVAPGQKDFRLVAANKFGKEKVEHISLRIDEPKVAGEVTEQPSELLLELQFSKAATITIVQDGQTLPEETVPAGALKRITAKDSIELTTSDAGSTQATLNGKKFGVLGRAGQSLTIPFTHDSEEFIVEESN